MYVIEYYVRSGGRKPAGEWIGSLEQSLQAVIDTKTKMLAQYGLELLKTDMVKTISGEDRDLHELRCGQSRIAFYFNRKQSKFVLLCGWLKKKQKHEKDIEYARRLVREYFSVSEGKEHV